MRLSFTADHPSNLYYAKEEAQLEVIVENPSAGSLPFAGSIDFGPAPAGKEPFKPTSITPIAATTVDAGQRLKISLTATLPSPGSYVLRCNNQFIAAGNGNPLRCIFAPRGLDASDSPWVIALPPGAVDTAGVLADFAQRTGIRRYVLDETWSPGADARMLTVAQREILWADVAGAKVGGDESGKGAGKCEVTVRLALTLAADTKHVAAFHQYVAELVAASKGAITAVVLDAGNALPNAGEIARFRAYYLAAYDAAKKANKSVLMLGGGSVVNTDLFLIAPPGENAAANLAAYVDIVAVMDTPADVRRALERAGDKEKKPLWVLPSRTGAGVPAAALKAANAAVIPVTLADRNVVPQLLGGTVATERMHEGIPPYVAIFQGDGYAVAAIAGLGAGTLLDADAGLLALVAPGGTGAGTPALSAATIKKDAPEGFVPDPPHGPPLVVEPATLEVADDARAMNAVDCRGGALACRTGDILNIPVTGEVAYLLSGGSAEDLTGLLRTALPHGLPRVAVSVRSFVVPTFKTPGKLVVSFKNITAGEISGSIEVYAVRGRSTQGLAEEVLKTLAAGQTREMTIALVNVDTLDSVTLDVMIGKSHQLHTVTAPSLPRQ